MNTPTDAYRRLHFEAPPQLLAGLDGAVNRLAGKFRRRARVAMDLRSQAEAVGALAAQFKLLTDFHLHQRLMEMRGQFRRGGRELEHTLPMALAAIREAADRKLGLRPFVVQLMGALALQRGNLAEMATGEGKTLTAGLAAVLAGWTRQPCHIVTVNDYLVERDAEWMRPLYTFCGVRVGWVSAAMGPTERLKNYEADVTYVSSKELLADFLRDRLRLGTVTNPTRRLIRELLRPRPAPGADGLVMRGLHTAIVDEADSVLIDEAVTPLIISAPQKNTLLESAVTIARQVAELLEPGEDYQINTRYREIEFSGAGLKKLDAACRDLSGLWRGTERRMELVRQAVSAREFFLRDKQYIVADGKVVIVDEFTGRIMTQRSWRQGLHQAIEVKEGLPVSDPNETVARLSFQRFFRCFRKLAGMTGTAREAAAELWHIYKLPVVAIPTNRPSRQGRLPDTIFVSEAEKFHAVAEETRRLHRLGRPVLIGTRSVAASEKLALLLGECQLNFRVLNAARHKEEATIVAQAGERGHITIATNMAGRGTDIKLGLGVAESGGLHVLATERHESSRVDRQLFGRAARQGDPGSGQMFLSIEDELVNRYLPARVNQSLRRAAQGRWPGWQRLALGAFTAAQRRAQGQAYLQRQNVLRSDVWLDESLSFAGLNVVQ